MSGTFDSLTAARKLEAAGWDRKQAEAIAHVVRKGKETMSGEFDPLTAARELEAAELSGPERKPKAIAHVVRVRQGCAD